MIIFHKKAFRDFFKRGFPIFLVAVSFFLFCEIMMFLLVRTSYVSWQGEVFRVNVFDLMIPGICFAVISPFVIVFRKMGTHISRQSGDLFWSLPVTKTGLCGTLIAVAFSYLAIYLAAVLLTNAVCFNVTSNVIVGEHYYTGKIAMITVLFLMHLGIAMLCFSKASGPLWYGIYSVAFVMLVVFSYWCWDVIITEHEYMLLSDYRLMWERRMGGRVAAGLMELSDRILFSQGMNWDLWYCFGKVVFVPLILGIGLLVLSFRSFHCHKAERTDGKNLSKSMHILFQGTLPWVIWFQLMGAEFPDMLRGFLILTPVCLVWEGFFQKSARKAYRAWPGISIGMGLSGLLLILACI